MNYGISCICRRYRQQVKDFLYTLVGSKSLCKKDSNESSLTLEVWDDKIESKDEEKLIENKNVLNDSVQCADRDDFLFTIDKRPNVKNDLDIPTYGQVTLLFLCMSVS